MHDQCITDASQDVVARLQVTDLIVSQVPTPLFLHDQSVEDASHNVVTRLRVME